MPDLKPTPHDDSVTHAPEAGEPKETGKPNEHRNPGTAARSESSPPGHPTQGEDFESGRADATV